MTETPETPETSDAPGALDTPGALPASDAPDTVVEAIAVLRSLGYEDELDVGDAGLICETKGFTLDLDTAKVDHVYRFEGASDPADMSIVLGVSSADGRYTGILVSAYGAEIDERYEAALDALEF